MIAISTTKIIIMEKRGRENEGVTTCALKTILLLFHIKPTVSFLHSKCLFFTAQPYHKRLLPFYCIMNKCFFWSNTIVFHTLCALIAFDFFVGITFLRTPTDFWCGRLWVLYVILFKEKNGNFFLFYTKKKVFITVFIFFSIYLLWAKNLLKESGLWWGKKAQYKTDGWTWKFVEARHEQIYTWLYTRQKKRKTVEWLSWRRGYDGTLNKIRFLWVVCFNTLLKIYQ